MRSSPFVIAALSVALFVEVARAELVDRIVAIIDREVVTLSEAEQARAVAEMRSGESRPLADIVEQLIERRLIEREVARFASATVPDDVAEEALASLRASFPDEDSFRSALGENGIDEEKLLSELRHQLQIHQYLERRFRVLTYVTAEEVNRYYREEILPELPPGTAPDLTAHQEQIRKLLEEEKFNDRVEQWLEEAKNRARIRRYVW